jgi:YggT family protein
MKMFQASNGCMFTKEDAQKKFSLTFLFFFIFSMSSTLCDPYLNIFRGIIPPLGGIDLSPILAFLVLDAFTSTAAALPAELPASYQETTSASSTQSDLTTTQRMWKRRLCSKKSQKTETSI